MSSHVEGKGPALVATIPPISSPYHRAHIFEDIALIANESVVVDSSIRTVLAIDNDTLARRNISGSAVGQGTALSEPTGIAYDSTRKILLLVDPPANAVFAIEPVSQRARTVQLFQDNTKRITFGDAPHCRLRFPLRQLALTWLTLHHCKGY